MTLGRSPGENTKTSLLSPGLHFHQSLIQEWFSRLFTPSFSSHTLETPVKIQKTDSGRKHIYQNWHIDSPDAINTTSLLECLSNSSRNYNLNLKIIKMRCYITEHKTHGVKYPVINTRALYLHRKFPMYKCHVRHLRIILHHVKWERMIKRHS